MLKLGPLLVFPIKMGSVPFRDLHTTGISTTVDSVFISVSKFITWESQEMKKGKSSFLPVFLSPPFK